MPADRQQGAIIDGRREWIVYVCDKCGDLADSGFGELLGCTNLKCDALSMRETLVVEKSPDTITLMAEHEREGPKS